MDMDDFLDKESTDGEKKVKEKPLEMQRGEDPLVYIEEIRNLITQKDYEKAERMYITAKEKFGELTKRQQEDHERIYRSLEKVNKEMVAGLNSFRHEASKKIEVIIQLIEKVKIHLKQNELDMANKLYSEIDKMFTDIPDIFPEQKMRIEQTIASLHILLTSRNHNANSMDFQKKWNDIGKQLAEANKLVIAHDMMGAARLYHKINSLYEELPKGFLYEKAVVYQQILKLFKAVHSSRHQVTPENSEGANPEKNG